MSLTKVSYSMIEGAYANVLDFGAVGDGVVDDTVAIQTAINAMIDTGGTVYFPVGVYKITSTLYLDQGTKSVEGLSLVGEGNGDSSADDGSTILYDGNLDADLVMIETGDKDFIWNRIEGLSINANNKAGYCLHLKAWGDTTHLNKNWTFNKVSFWRAATASVFIGDMTKSGGDYTPTPKDSDAFMNVFNQCSFCTGSLTAFHVILNVANNCYQTTFRDCDVALANPNLICFLRQMSGQQTVVENFFAGAYYQQLGTEVSVFWVEEGSIEVRGCKSEEPRILYKEGGAYGDQTVALYDVTVNAPTNRPDNGQMWKSVVDLGSRSILLCNCKFWTATYNRIVESATTELSAINAYVSDGNFNGIAPWVWQGFTFESGWSNTNISTFNPCEFRKGNNQYIELHGNATGGTGTIAVLPTGYRPTRQIRLTTTANGAFAEIIITIAGEVILQTGSATAVSLENLGFFIY